VGDAEFSVLSPDSARFYCRTGAAPGLNQTTPQIEMDVGLSEEERNAHVAIDSATATADVAPRSWL